MYTGHRYLLFSEDDQWWLVPEALSRLLECS